MIGVGTTIFLVNPQTFGGTSYLLDTYSATSAYSLRQLKTGVTNVVRVRRSGDNAESDFTATDITDGSLVTWVVAGGGLENGDIVKWYDQSGNSINATQTTAAAQPRLVASGALVTDADGNNALDFQAGGDSMLVFGNGNVYNNKSYGAAFCVYENDSSSRRDLWGWHTPNQNFSRFTSSDSITASRHSVVTRRLDADGVTLLTDGVNFPTGVKLRTDIIDWANNDAFIRRDGSQVASSTSHGTAGSTSSTNSYIVMRADQTSGIGKSYTNTPVQYMTELIFFNTDISGDISSIESDINTHYSIY